MKWTAGLLSLIVVGGSAVNGAVAIDTAAAPIAVDTAGVGEAKADSEGAQYKETVDNGGFPKKVGPFLVWSESVYEKYEKNEFRYSKHLVGNSSIHGCCATHVHVLWERRKDEIHSVDVRYPLVVAVPNFVCDVESVVDVAVDQVNARPESEEHIESRMKSTDTKRRGGGYPGPQIGAGTEVSTQMLRCIKPVMAEYFPYIDQLDYRSRVFLFSLASLGAEGLLRGQKLPHTDIDWHFGVDPDPFHSTEIDGSTRYFVPQGIAAVFGLTNDFQDTGTGLFRSKFPSPGGGTPFDFLPTKWRNEQFYATMMKEEQAYGQTIEDNVTGYYGSGVPASADNNPFVEKTITAPVQYNQVVFYDMRRLHSLVVDEAAEPRLSPKPLEGRLTLNMFWWQQPFEKSERPCSAYTSCEGCSATPFCTWCAKVGECVVNEEHACKGAQHRAGYEGFARCDLHEFVAAGAGRNGLAGGKPRASVPVAPAASEYCTGFGSCSASSSDEESDSKEQPKLQQQQAEDSLPTETEGSIANSATQQESLLGFGAFGLE